MTVKGCILNILLNRNYDYDSDPFWRYSENE